MKRTVWDELENSFNGLKKDYPKGFTTREFAENSGVCLRVAREKLSAMVKNGSVRYAGNRPTVRMDGRANVAPVYQLVRPLKKKA